VTEQRAISGTTASGLVAGIGVGAAIKPALARQAAKTPAYTTG